MRRTLLALLAFSLAGISACASGPPEGGPIDEIGPHGWGGIITEVNAPFTDEFEQLIVRDARATIVSVELLETSPAVEIIGVMLAGQDRVKTSQIEYVYPPVDPELGTLRPAIGAVLEPQEGSNTRSYELLIGMRVTEEGKFFRPGLVITYESEGKTYKRTSRGEITICTPKAVEKDGTCPMIDTKQEW